MAQGRSCCEKRSPEKPAGGEGAAAAPPARPPRAHLNAPVQIAEGRIEVDFLWPDHRFALEADSRDFHGTAVAFERDRWRDRELTRAGYATLRVTHRQAETEAASVADAIAVRLESPAAGSRFPHPPGK